MITIDRLSFDFVATDEQFANNLYANWDSFCQHCFEKVVEECLSEYDQETIIREFEKLELNLGVIPQNDFYREFPKRLKDEFLRITQYWGTETAEERQKSESSRIENILFYLEHGYTLEIWGGQSFDLTKEIQWAFGESEACFVAVTKLCINKSYVFFRMVEQINDYHPILKMYAGVLIGTYSQNEKQLFLEMLLDINPDIPVRFVHETGDETSLHSMSELLNTHSVRQIMKTETEEHAEVDLPPYWHYLYEWLVQYYPFNGLAIFGSKGDFVQHLHFRLLTYIHKRNYAYYLSKTELTLTFLQEVFGRTYFKDVLNAIYLLQPHHEDGTPVYDSYLNRELYKIFMLLSLLKFPSVDEKKSETTSEESSLLSKLRQGNLPLDVELLSEFLSNSRYSKADKQYTLGVLSIERAESLRFWLENEDLKDVTISNIAEIMDWTFVMRVVASISFQAQEWMERTRSYLLDTMIQAEWMIGISETKLELVLRKVVLLWISKKGYGLSENESIRLLFRLVYQEITGKVVMKEDSNIVESYFPNFNQAEVMPIKQFLKGTKSRGKSIDVRKLKQLLIDENMPDSIKQRLVVLFFERFKEYDRETVADSFDTAILLLYKHGILDNSLGYLNSTILEVIIHSLVTKLGIEETTGRITQLFLRFLAHESIISGLLIEHSIGLNAQILLWLANAVESQSKISKTETYIVSSFIRDLFGMNRERTVIRLLFQEESAHHDSLIVSNEEAINEYGLVLNMLSETTVFTVSDFSEWNNMIESRLKTIQRLIIDEWNTADGLSEWFENSSITTTDKSELITILAIKEPNLFVNLLRILPNRSEKLKDLSIHIPTNVLLQSMTQVNFHQASLLVKIIALLKQKSANYPILVGASALFSPTFRFALLLYIQDSTTLGVQSLSDKEVLHKMIAFMCFIHTGKMDYHAESEWEKLSIEIAEDLCLDGNQILQDEKTFKVLQEKETSDVVFSQTIISLLENNPDDILTIVEANADSVLIKRIAKLSDITILHCWCTFLITVSGFEQTNIFKQTMMWFCTLASNHSMIAAITEALLFWIKDTDWKKQSAEQIENYFIQRLFGIGSVENNFSLSTIEILTDVNMPLTVRKKLIQSYIRIQPKKLLDYIRVTVKSNTVKFGYWAEWINTEGWIILAASQSIMQAEKLRQITECLLTENSLKKEVIELALATVVLDCNSSGWINSEKDGTVHRFLQALSHLSYSDDEANSSISIKNTLEKALSIDEEYILSEEVEDDPDYVFINNAGLCLLSPWFPQLFDMLGYLNEEKKDFKDTISRIRAVFVLQYLVYPEERDFSETELVLNRILVSLRMSVPLPQKIKLTDEEKLSADSMVSAVKAYWPKMSGTSLKGFRQSFISRSGHLEQQDEKWILTVVDKVYDVILDTVPWSFRQIRYHWLKKYIQVSWHEKQEF